MGFEEFCGNSITISGKEMIYKYHIYSVKVKEAMLCFSA